MALKLTHWEYSFILHTTELGADVRITTNPFTGERMEIPADHGLTAEQIDAVSAVLTRYNVRGPDPEITFSPAENERVSFYNVQFLQGKRICDLEASVLAKQISDRQLNFIRDVVRAGKFALMSGVGHHVRLLEQTSTEAIVARWPGVELINGIAQLRWWLQNVVRGWKCAVVP